MACIDDFRKAFSGFRISTLCFEPLVTGYGLLLTELKTSSSLTSTRYPVWSVVRRNLDDAFIEAINKFTGEWNRELFTNCKLSEMGKCGPIIQATPSDMSDPAYTKAWLDLSMGSAGEKSELPLRPFNDGWSFKTVSKNFVKPAKIIPIDSQFNNIGLWEANFKCALSNLELRTSETREIIDTLGFVLYKLIPLLRRFRPTRTTVHPDHDSLMDVRTCTQNVRYCELCWRLSIRSVHMSNIKCLVTNDEEIQAAKINAGRFSQRYCSVHSPGSARYHADLRYKKAFHHEISALLNEAYSKYSIQLSPIKFTTIKEVRKIAYELTHSKLRFIRSEDAQAIRLSEKVYLLAKEGFSQSEIARKLDVHRQAVSRAIKRMDTLRAAHAASCKLDELTGEFVVSDSVRDRIRLGLARQPKPESLAAIAKAVGLTKATVEDISISLRENSSVEQ